MLSSRRNFSVADIQYREKRPKSNKILFISCEGLITEEVYFEILSENIFLEIKNNIRMISVREEYNKIEKNLRTQEDIDNQNKSTPRQVMNRMDYYLTKHKDVFKPEENSDDEYWLVIDVDDHTDANHIEEWTNILNECDEKNYQYAISNPFFELWLYLHHMDISNEAYKYAVTKEHTYEKTNYYVTQMKTNGIKMTGKGSKKPRKEDFNIEKIKNAIAKAKQLDQKERWPHSLGSTVYILVEKMMKMLNS